MANLQPRFRSLHGNPQFLMQFAAQCELWRFAALHLAAGKFPQSTLMNVIGPPGDEHRAGSVDDDADRHLNRTAHVRYSALIRT